MPPKIQNQVRSALKYAPREDAEKICEVVRPYMPETMLYKIGGK